MKVHCPYCKQRLRDILIEFRASDHWRYNEKTNKWDPSFAFMPDQGETRTRCARCKKIIHLPSPDPNGLSQEELNDMN